MRYITTASWRTVRTFKLTKLLRNGRFLIIAEISAERGDRLAHQRSTGDVKRGKITRKIENSRIFPVSGSKVRKSDVFKNLLLKKLQAIKSYWKLRKAFDIELNCLWCLIECTGTSSSVLTRSALEEELMKIKNLIFQRAQCWKFKNIKNRNFGTFAPSSAYFNTLSAKWRLDEIFQVSKGGNIRKFYIAYTIIILCNKNWWIIIYQEF